MNLQQELKRAKEAAKKAGDKVMEIYNSDYDSFNKEDGSAVTEADLEAEKIILSELEKFDYEILSEETKDNPQRLKAEKVWIVDPLDGTRDFLDKTGEFSIMIGLAFEGKPVLGVVYQPTTEKLYYGMQGQGAYLNDERIESSSVSRLNESRFVVSRSHLDDRTAEFLNENDASKVLMGSAGLKIGTIAEGKAEAYITTNTYQWDSCAPQAILEAAGGQVTNLNGKELEYNRKEVKNTNGVVASNSEIHRKIVNGWN